MAFMSLKSLIVFTIGYFDVINLVNEATITMYHQLIRLVAMAWTWLI